jgi:CBS domain-containing protein
MKPEKVKEIMTRTPITCNPDTTLAEVVNQLSLAEINGIVVVDHSSGEPRGIVSQSDLLKHYGDDLNSSTAAQIMTINLQKISGEARIEDAARKMVEQGVRRLIVVEEGSKKAAGVISASDIIQAMATA